MDPLQQLQQILGSDWSTEHIRSVLPQILALGIHVQNEARGDYRPRFLLPNGDTWDFGPGGWVGRGNIGDWHSGSGGGDGGGGGGDDQPQGGDDGGGGGGLVGGTGGIPGAFLQGIPAGMDPREFFLQQTPGYKFAFNEGQRAVQTGAAAKGTLLTGGTLKALARYGTGVADQLYGDQTNRYLSLADLGARVATAPF